MSAARADLNEQIEVRRTPQGKLRVEGVIETSARKAELLVSLASLRNNPAVEIQLQTVAVAAQSQQAARQNSRQTPAATLIEQTEITAATLPVEAELRRYFSARGLSGDRLEEEMRRFASATLARSLKLKSHATTLRQLAARFSPAEVQALDAEARRRRLELLGGHACALAGEAGQLRAKLAPVFAAAFSTDGGDGAETVYPGDEESLRRACNRLAELGATADRATRAAFTLSTSHSGDASPAAALRAASFSATLRRIEHLAEAVSAFR